MGEELKKRIRKEEASNKRLYLTFQRKWNNRVVCPMLTLSDPFQKNNYTSEFRNT